MATILTHRGTRIVTLADGERIEDHCVADDMAIVATAQGWWLYFVGPDDDIDGYDEPYDSADKALWAAKAAAEFAAE